MVSSCVLRDQVFFVLCIGFGLRLVGIPTVRYTCNLAHALSGFMCVLGIYCVHTFAAEFPTLAGKVGANTSPLSQWFLGRGFYLAINCLSPSFSVDCTTLIVQNTFWPHRGTTCSCFVPSTHFPCYIVRQNVSTIALSSIANVLSTSCILSNLTRWQNGHIQVSSLSEGRVRVENVSAII